MINKKEMIRYLGYGKTQPDDRVLELIDICAREVEAIAEPRSVSRRFPLVLEGNDIWAGGQHFHSGKLARNLKDCTEVLFFAATLGNGVDRLLNKYLRLQMSKAVIVQAAAAAAIEDYCDACQKAIREKMAEEGLYVRPRYSPGYGDLDLSVQEAFLQTLNAQKTVGIVLTEGNIMLPEKSVTAVMGLSPVPVSCHRAGCEACAKTDCAYRRDRQDRNHETG